VSLRVKRGAVESVPKGMLGDCINLVIWRHEHDYGILPKPVTSRSLVQQWLHHWQTESPYQVPSVLVLYCGADGLTIIIMYWHCALLEVKGKNFETTRTMLRTRAPLQTRRTRAAEEEGLDLTDKIGINKYLKAKSTNSSCEQTLNTSGHIFMSPIPTSPLAAECTSHGMCPGLCLSSGSLFAVRGPRIGVTWRG
jgi:hypothetical protein